MTTAEVHPEVRQVADALIAALGGDLRALAFLIELGALNGRAQLPGERLHTVLTY